MTVRIRPYPAYTDSGVPWLGDVPAHWQLRRAKWLFRKMDRPVRHSDDVITCFRDGTVTLRRNRRTRGFTESLKEIGYQGIRRGDLVIHAMDAFAGAVGVSDSDGKGTPVYSVCEPGPDADARYFAFAVREMARSQWILALAKGIRERSTDFRFEAFASQGFPLPPLAEQRAIVRYLDTIDRRIRRYIRAKQKLLKLLEEQKQALIHQAVTRGLDPNVRLKPSGVEWLGDVPEHWEIVRISKCLSGRNAGIWGTEPDESNADDHIVCVRVADFDMAHLSVSEQKLTVRAVAKTARMSRLLAPGDLLIEKSGGGDAQPVGRAVLFNLGQPCVCSNFIERLIPDRTQVQSHFLLWVLTDLQASRHNVPSIKQTTGIQNLDLGQYFANVLALPPLDEQDRILSTMRFSLDRVQTAVQNTTRSISLLQEYRTRLIADVVTGKLDVREAAARLPDEPTDDDAELAVDDLSEGTETEDEEVPADSEAFD